MSVVFKAWEELTICDDYMFKATMRNKQVCKEVLEAILSQPIREIVYLEDEVTLKSGYLSKGVRLDVYVEDEAHTVYNVEMQVRRDGDDLAKRMRYYQSQLDVELLAAGQKYAELSKTIIIFICPFDPVGRGWHLYWYENTCRKDATLKLDDGAIKIILNTHGTGDDISPKLQAFMNYVNSGILSSDPLVQAIDRQIQEVKQSEAERMRYMKYELDLSEAREDGVAEGKAKERALMIRIWQLLQKKVSLPEIALKTDLSLDEVRKIAEECGFVY